MHCRPGALTGRVFKGLLKLRQRHEMDFPDEPIATSLTVAGNSVVVELPPGQRIQRSARLFGSSLEPRQKKTGQVIVRSS